MAGSPARCPLTTRLPRAPWRRRRTASLAAGLAPIDREAFRQQYGQEGLFRLRLGVDAAEQPPKAGAAPQSCSAASWAGSPQKQRYDAAMDLRKYYAAGEALGEWRGPTPPPTP